MNGLSVAFVLYILTYAYISAGGSIIAHTLEGIVGVGQTTAGLVFALVVAFIVWLSTRAVDRLSTILIGGMVITFVMSVGDMFTTCSLRCCSTPAMIRPAICLTPWRRCLTC